MPKKGIPHRKWSHELKVEIVEKNVKDGISVSILAKDYSLRPTLIKAWRKIYMENGPEGLAPKVKGRPKSTLGAGRPKTAFTSEIERLQYENAKLKLEVARLKKLQEL
jgi:transposase-like protein